jgi:putative ABC transport system ATP-binding protein
MIYLDRLSKVYHHSPIETTALNGVSLHIQQGEFVSIMGPSGCGKSTLLNLLGLLDAPSHGRYQLMGEEVSRHPERKRALLRKQHLGFVFQHVHLIEELTVLQNVALPMVYAHVSPHARTRRAEEALDRMGMMSRRHHHPRQLSGGQQQRVALARAIVNRPTIILADEPTGNLDRANSEAVMTLLSEQHAQGATIAMVTHSPTCARYGDRIIHLLDGQVLAETLR